jgi:hypothetical protein
MSDRHASTRGPRVPTGYEIRLAGHLDRRWAEWFDGLALTHHGGTTVLRGPVVDQAALHGLLQKVRDLGVPLVSVTQIALEPPAALTDLRPIDPR